MEKLGLAVYGVLATGLLSTLAMSSSDQAIPVLRTSDDIATLERQAAETPTTEHVSALVSAYLTHDQPGLAQAVLDRHAELDAPEITHQKARVALAQGDAEHALHFARLTVETCDVNAAHGSPCAAWLVAKTTRQLSLIQAMTDAGISDPASDPARAQVALARADRQVAISPVIE